MNGYLKLSSISTGGNILSFSPGRLSLRALVRGGRGTLPLESAGGRAVDPDEMPFFQMLGTPTPIGMLSPEPHQTTVACRVGTVGFS